jgi:sec-independent protein translocase protein TatA
LNWGYLKKEMAMVYDVMLGFGIGAPELAVILVVGLLVFGNRLPEVGKSLGRSIVEFKKGIRGVEDEIDKSATNDDKDKQPKS